MEFIINKEMHLTCPEGFHVMTEEELDKLNFIAKGDCEVLSDPERRIMISVGWRSAKGISSLLLRPNDIIRNEAKTVAQANKNLNFRMGDYTESVVGGENANGFRYGYTTDEIDMAVETLVLKHNKKFYYIHFYSREDMMDENKPLWEKVLKDITFA